MSKVPRQKQQHLPKETSAYWNFALDVGRWTLNVGLLLVLCAFTAFAQDTKCELKLAELPNAPELFGFRMGMTPAEVKVRVPQVAFAPPNEFGVAKTSINPDFDSSIDKASLAGVRTVSLDFLDNRLTSLWLGFDGTFKWKTVPDFVKGISQSFHLPDAWQSWRGRGQKLSCADFELNVTMVVEGPSFRIIDDKAEQTVAERREAKEELEAAAEAAAALEVIADPKARVYYLKTCELPESLNEGSRLLFKTKEEAEKAGYKLANDCD